MWTVSQNESGQKLVQYLKNKLPGNLSSRELKRAIESNLCRVNGYTERFASVRVFKGDTVAFDVSDIDVIRSQNFVVDSNRILFEDDAFFIYNKPSGIACDEKGVLSLFPDYHLVHRLDKETTGVLILAKKSSIKDAMITQFRNYHVKKEYKALIVGAPDAKSGVIENQLGKLKQNEGQTIWGSVKSGKRAKTTWKLDKRREGISSITCYPETGRTHQIRVHMAEMGHPVLGDYQYGREVKHPNHPKRMFLHAYSISFTHPVTNQSHTITANLPEDFKERVLV